MTSTALLTSSDRFAQTIDGLLRAVAARIAGGALKAALIMVIWQRIRRVEGKILALLARFRAGRLVVRPSVRMPGRRGGQRGVAAILLPRRFGWLCELVPCQAANFGSQLRVILAEPEMAALLAASPQAVRLLRPLCRMLAVEPDILMPKVPPVVEKAPQTTVTFPDAPPTVETGIPPSPPQSQARSPPNE